MYQIHIEYENEESFDESLLNLKRRVEEQKPSAMLFHVFNATSRLDAAKVVVYAIRERFPGVPYVGTCSGANLIDGELVRIDESVTVVCDVFEDPDTTIELVQFPLDYKTQHDTAQAFLDAVAARPNVRAVEMIATVHNVNMPLFCDTINSMRDDIVFFGGGAITPSTDFGEVIVFSSSNGASSRGAVFVLYSGSNLHAKTQTLQGWKPLGMPFHVTRAERSTLYELDGKPAYETYHHYLKIANDDKFAWNGLVFPISRNFNGVQVLRTPSASNPDGSLELPADITGMRGECRIAYGDPSTILASVRECATAMREFHPQAILAFSCMARLKYWGPKYVNRETQPLQNTAPTAGFFSGGEFVRQNHLLIHHNLTLLVVGLREGDAEPLEPPEDDGAETTQSSNVQLDIIHRLATFIGAASDELQAAYERMEAIASTDGLTGLANRLETERRIGRAIEAVARPGNRLGPNADADPNKLAMPTVVMFDLDNFKQVNDTYGHEMGDEVLREAARIARDVAAEEWPEATAGRWGGEEFMIVIPSCTIDEALRGAERIRAEFAAREFEPMGHRTMSLGVAQLEKGESLDSLCSRADHALYDSKGLGKNTVTLAGKRADS